MTSLCEQARAKVNLTLHVTGRRADGYHDLESLVAFADCADAVRLDPGNGLTLKVTGPRADECGSLDDNLVLKAARALVQRVAPLLRAGAFELDKQLPAASGIGGGSADAAAALRLLARANGLRCDDPAVADAARATGADVPVCLGSASCIMTGVGEKLAPVEMPQLPCVLVNPGVAVATRDVFAALGLKPGDIARPEPSIVWPGKTAAADQWIGAIRSGRNDLEAPALRIQPVISEVLAALRSSEGCDLARMSGSGATCFGLFRDGTSAARAARRLDADHAGWWVVAAVLG